MSNNNSNTGAVLSEGLPGIAHMSEKELDDVLEKGSDDYNDDQYEEDDSKKKSINSVPTVKGAAATSGVVLNN